MIPNLEAEIIPAKSIADITLGLDFDHFKANSKYQIINDYTELESTYSERDKWLILHRNEILPWGDSINEIYCYWNKIITLTFNSSTQRLESIYAGQGYQGKLLGLLGIGDRLDSVKHQYNFYFWGDKHYLEYKEDSNKAGELIPVEIGTNYRTAYSDEYSDQIIEGFLIYLPPEERGHLT
ncbi:hypothetical protein [Acinetobacter radioresistens]|uniref:hypothetical protein n=1 Tax=Acinetobacter radioresistens TaxID=40216 RepID=UPI0009464912|nr:hypothetical protein [Acinetobacter radioresistens]